ncbi:MAG: acyl carrier protein [Bdellovibrionales bacterium]|nr:acyl carrier protein [Bdellovibrionales bacterium]
MTDYNPQIVAIVNGILQQKFEVPLEKMKSEARLKEDLNLDSLDFVDMFILLEQKLGKTPQNVDFMKITTLGDIYQMVMDLNAEIQKN